MGLKIFGTQFAEDKLQDIFYYYKEKAGIKTARKIINEIIDKTIMMKIQKLDKLRNFYKTDLKN